MNSPDPLAQAVSAFGAALKPKLSRKGAAGAPEDQLRAPLERLIADLAAVALFRPGQVVAVGETTLSELKTRPDYAIKAGDLLIGFIEVKAPGKAPIPAASATTTTVPNGTNSKACPTSSTPTATPFPSGAPANCTARSCACTATWKPPAPRWPLPTVCNVCSPISCAGNP